MARTLLLVLVLVGANAGTLVLLKDVHTLTLTRGEYTTGHRSAAKPQLTCQGAACAVWTAPALQCRNTGTNDAGAVVWACDADVPPTYELGSVRMSCESYTSNHDTYVLVGSCGATYNLRTAALAAMKRYQDDATDAIAAAAASTAAATHRYSAEREIAYAEAAAHPFVHHHYIPPSVIEDGAMLFCAVVVTAICTVCLWSALTMAEDGTPARHFRENNHRTRGH